MKRLIVFTTVMLFASCKHQLSTSDLQYSVAQSFNQETGYKVLSVELVKTEDYLYTGYVLLEDSSKAQISVNLDKDEPQKYIWKCTQPSPTMLQKIVKKMQEQVDKNIDSFLNATAPPMDDH